MRDPPAALAASRVASSLETGGPASPATTYKPDPKRGKGAGLPGSDDLYLDAALGALNVGVGAEGRPLPSITSTPTVAFKRSRFAGHAAPVASVGDVEFVVAALKGAQRCVPYAYRLAGGAPGAPPEGAREGRDDGGDVGVGDKLLHLLTQWDVENVVLVVTRDDSKSIVGGEALGVRRFKIVIDCAKSVLELCYLDSLRRTLRASRGSGPEFDAAASSVPASAHGAALSAPPPPVPTGVLRRSRSGSSHPVPEEASSLDAASVGSSSKSAAQKPLPEKKPTRPMGPDAPNMMFRPRGPMWKPTRTALGTTADLPEGRDVDSCGIPLTRALGRVNNFRHGFDAQRESPSKIVAMRPLDDETLYAGSVDAAYRDDDDGGASGPAPSPAAYDDEGFGLPRSAVATALPMPPDLDSSLRSEIRAMRQPHAEVELVLRCVAALVDGPRWILRKRSGGPAARAPPYDVDWVDVRFALSEPEINARLACFDASRPPGGAPAAVLGSLVSAGLGPRAMDRLRIRSFVAAEFLPWLWAALAVEIDPDQLAHAISFLPKTIAHPAGTRDDVAGIPGKKLLPPDEPDMQNRVGPRIQADPDPVDRLRATVQECVNRHNKLVELNIGADETFPMDELRALYADADDALFKKAVKLFDWSSKGEAALENVKMFSLLMVALLHPSEAGKMERTTFDIAFAIFDADASGNLEVDEFKAMFRALYQTRVSALKLVYTSKAGHAMLQEFAESELSTENMEFVDAVDAWAAMDDAQRGTLAAGGLLDQFVGEAAKTPVNLPAKATAKLQAEYKAAVDGGVGTLGDAFFEESKKEILKVIEKDTFARFNKDRERMEALMKETFKEVDTDPDVVKAAAEPEVAAAA
ncbi:alpha-glucuronidase [Aureococcus anophagefferens]|uniref:Alpha-glucuronidase n=1 Tax=Aureococcus anophagefferens TaxID=44056 RepID=A0ABR1GA20_AURAN